MRNRLRSKCKNNGQSACRTVEAKEGLVARALHTDYNGRGGNCLRASPTSELGNCHVSIHRTLFNLAMFVGGNEGTRALYSK